LELLLTLGGSDLNPSHGEPPESVRSPKGDAPAASGRSSPD
jgi:hypothetical protein